MIQTTYLASGCFWGMQQLFRQQPGVIATEVGYCGGNNSDPSFDYHPGHAETLKITYEDNLITFSAILDFFFRIHDPTTLNRQGNDIGDTYRSAIFYKNKQELIEAKDIISKVEAKGLYSGKIVTTLEKYTKFYPAEEYHQDYLQKHPNGYTCHFIRTNERII